MLSSPSVLPSIKLVLIRGKMARLVYAAVVKVQLLVLDWCFALLSFSHSLKRWIGQGGLPLTAFSQRYLHDGPAVLCFKSQNSSEMLFQNYSLQCLPVTVKTAWNKHVTKCLYQNSKTKRAGVLKHHIESLNYVFISDNVLLINGRHSDVPRWTEMQFIQFRLLFICILWYVK